MQSYIRQAANSVGAEEMILLHEFMISTVYELTVSTSFSILISFDTYDSLPLSFGINCQQYTVSNIY